VAKVDTAKPNDEKGMTTGDVPLPDAKAFMALVRRGEKGEARAVAEVRAILKAHPTLWGSVNVNLSNAAREALLKAVTGPNELAADSIARNMETMKRKIVGENPSHLELLLADRIAMCWLRVQYAELSYASVVNKSVGFKQGDYLQRQAERAQAQYLAAIRTLAQVRKLGLPDVQVNIGDKQVNIAGGPQVNAPQIPALPAVAEGQTM